MPIVVYKLTILSLFYLASNLVSGQALGEALDTTVDYVSGDTERCVVLLHGLARSSSSMKELSDTLENHGFNVALVDYPSRNHPIKALSQIAVGAGLDSCRKNGAKQIYFVTHSLGGILVRVYLDEQPIPELHRVVMLAPPNHGSEVVDNVKSIPGVAWMNGPAFLQLGTDEHSVPLSLGPVSVDTAVIAGSSSINLILSNFLDNPDDGKVSVESARLEGMCAMLVLPVSHPFIMTDELAIEQTISYLNTGEFSLSTAEYLDCETREG